jgi:hypothetical protein
MLDETSNGENDCLSLSLTLLVLEGKVEEGWR